MSKILSEIVLNNIKNERKQLSKHACFSFKGIRQNPDREKIADRENIRPVFFHDTDRIIHSSAYTRYIDKTQVFSLFENDHITHRVLHVQFVSKIARVIGRALRLNEDLIEAIALGHDLGHTPFGHDGEKILNELCVQEGIGYFCHNVQGVKLLQEIENNGQGLNLSLQVLDGILAHNGEILKQEYTPCDNKTWDDFLEQYHQCFEQEQIQRQIRPMTLEACIVKISDIIAYVGRDIEDAITVKLIKRKDVPDKIGQFNDQIINALVLDLIENSYGKNYLKFSEDKFLAFQELIAFNYKEIYTNLKIKTESHKIEGMFTQLFYKYLDDIEKNNTDSIFYTNFLANLDDNYKNNNVHKRMIVDFISTMTDSFFVNQYKKSFLPESFGYSV